MTHYRKTVLVEAFKWTGGPDQTEDPDWIVDAIRRRDVTFNDVSTPEVTMRIHTPEGLKTASIGDWIIRDARGEVYPCPAAIFDAVYEAVE